MPTELNSWIWRVSYSETWYLELVGVIVWMWVYIGKFSQNCNSLKGSFLLSHKLLEHKQHKLYGVVKKQLLLGKGANCERLTEAAYFDSCICLVMLMRNFEDPVIVNVSVFCFVCFLMCLLKLCVAAIFMFILWLTNWPMTRQGEDSFHQCCVDRCFKCVVTSLSTCVFRLMLLMWYNRELVSFPWCLGKFSRITNWSKSTKILSVYYLNEVLVRLDFILSCGP